MIRSFFHCVYFLFREFNFFTNKFCTNKFEKARLRIN
jgi:hypothetical protein